jgi:hypothetical protein
VLVSLFEQWCAQPVSLHFEGGEVLKSVLKSCTPRGDPRRGQMWWRLRLDALRTLGLRDEFEDVAVEFCLVYELSPPCWKDPLCSLNNVASKPPGEQGATPSVDSNLPAKVDSAVELSGLLVGDSVDAIGKLGGMKSSTYFRISCTRLIRAEFMAAGNILNLADFRESEDYCIYFFDVPRLAATFFNVMGINEHAKVTVQTN